MIQINFFDGLVVLICCHQSQTWSLTLKLGFFFQCSSTFPLYCLWISSRWDTSWVQTFANHMVQSSAIGFTTLCTTWMSNLGWKPWFVKKRFVGLMNALCYCKQILPWPKVLINYLDDNWLCTINIVPKFDWFILFTHLSRGGKLMITSLSHLKTQRIISKTWM
jgi:hypothetical protein